MAHAATRRTASRWQWTAPGLAAAVLSTLIPLGCAPHYLTEPELHGHAYSLGVPVRYAIVDQDRDTPVQMAYVDRRPLGRALLTLVFVHGLTTDRELWRPLITRLPGPFRAVAPDRVGCGASSKPGWTDLPPNERYDLWRHAYHLFRFIVTATPRGPLVLVGHGFGAKVVLAAWLHYPSVSRRCRAVVLVNPDPYLSVRDPWADVPAYERSYADRSAHSPVVVALNQLLERDAAQAIGVLERSFHDRAFITREMVEQAVAGVRRRGALQARHRTACNLVFRDYGPFQQAIGRVDVPVLILQSREDRLVSCASALRYHRDLKRSVLVAFARAGHDLVRERPEHVAATIARFLHPLATTRPTTRPTRP